MTFGEKLRSIRKARGFSIEGFAKIIKLSPSYLSRLETGRDIPSAKTTKKIAKKLKSNPEDMLWLAKKDKMVFYGKIVDRQYP